MGTKRAYRLQEFAAHTSNVNCLKIGRKSSGVMVTGGEDRRVNLFAIGKPGAILSMTGHQSPVECVTFDRDEEVVVAGAAGGTLKLWDLESAKVVRTLVGHRSNCTSVDFHPFGEFFASGSLDTNLKIWDVRRKGCIHTYKGHDRGVGVCKFSPDGKWVVSGGQDGKVRLWDLTAGKLLKQLHVHDGPVTSIEFHPNELLLATGSADRTVKFWDLEMFGMVDECVESTGVKSMLFHPDGRNLLTGTSEFLKVWGWEPSISRDAVDVSWRNLQDLSTRENKLLGASIQNSFVGVWVVDLNQCAPFSGAARGPGGGGTRDADREHRHGQTPEESAAAAVAAAAELSKARVLRLEREAGTVRDGVTTADDKEPSTSNATDGFSGRPFDPRDVKADKEDREEGNRSPMAMNLKFAAAHGIGEDPMETTGQPPPAIVYAKPKPAPFSPVIPRRERKRDERRPGGETSSCPETRVVVPEVNEEIPEEVYEDDFVGVGAEDSLENVDEEDDDEMTRALGLGSDCIRKHEPTPRYSQSPTKPLSATKKHTPFQSPTRASPRKSYKRDTQEEAFNLETLRSAALEADTEFIDANGGGGGDALLDSDSVSIETLAVAMARARVERARDEDAPSTAATQRSSFEHVHQTTKTPTPTKASALLRAKSPLGVDFASFVPGAFEINGTPPTPTPDEHVVLHALSGEDSEIVLDIYHSRLNALKATSRAWIKGDAKAVANLLTQNNDHSATADVLGAALDAPFGGITGDGPVSLELGSHLVPLCIALLESKHASYQDVALRFSRRVLFAFEPVLAGAKSFMEGIALSGRRRGIGVDMAQEERIARAATTRVALLSQRDALVGIAQRSENTDLALKAREMLGALERLG